MNEHWAMNNSGTGSPDHKPKKSRFSLWKIKESWLGRFVKNLMKTPGAIGKMGQKGMKNINQRMFGGGMRK